MSTAVLTKTASFSTPDFIVGEITYLCDATSGPISVTLASPMQHGQKLTIKKVDASANAVTVAAESGTTIDGDPNQILSGQWDSMQLVVQNDRWYIV